MSEEVKILIFRLGEQCFAADIKEVERILNYEEPTRLPDSEDYLEGVINYQEGVLPVINLGKKFGIEDNASKEKASIIVARDGDTTLGIKVDSVNEVVTMNPNQLEDTPGISSSISKRYIRGIIKDKEKNVITLLLKLNELLSSEEKEKIGEIEG